MRIGEPARKHGIPDADIWHATGHYLTRFETRNLTMFIGPARNGAPLEIGVLDADGDDPAIIHAMPLRRNYYKYL